VTDSGSRVCWSSVRVWGLGIRIQGCRAWCFRFRLGFRAIGLGVSDLG
jgi:hypothetical protein